MLPAVGRVVVKGQDGQRHGHVDEQQTGQLVLFVSRCVVCWFSSRQKVHVNWPGLSQKNTAMSTGKGTFTVTCLHAADSCHEGRVNVTGQPCRRRQLEHVHRLLWAKKNVNFSFFLRLATLVLYNKVHHFTCLLISHWEPLEGTLDLFSICYFCTTKNLHVQYFHIESR